MTQAHRQYLKRRGITNAAQLMHWQPRAYYDGTPGFAIPVKDAGGSRERFRALDKTRDGQKTKWLGRAGEDYTPRYYYPPQIVDAIREAGGILYLASGETDLLTFIENKFLNVVSFSSENSVPDDLPAVLVGWGVKELRYPADKDAAGVKAAVKVRDALKDSGIAFKPLLWGEQVEKDTNDLWKTVNFNPAAFREVLGNLQALILPVEQPTEPRQWDDLPTDSDYERAIEQIKARIGQLLGISGYRNDGWSRKNIPSPFRDEKHASASYNINSGVLNDFGGDSHSFIELADHFRIDLPKRPRSRSIGNTGGQPKPSATTPDPAQQFDRRLILRGKQLDILYRIAHTAFNRPYVETVPAGSVIVDSPLGTGKSTALRSAATDDQSEFAFNDRRVLVGNLARDLNLDHYETFKGQYTGAIQYVDRVASTIDSAYKLAAAAPPDVLILEEVDYCFRQLAAQTMKADRRDENALTVRRLIKDSNRVIAVQGNVSPVGIEALKALRPGIQVHKNTYTPDRGGVKFVSSDAQVISRAIDTARSGGLAALTSDRRNLLQAIDHQPHGSDYEVIAIHGHKTQEPETQALLQNINQHLKDTRAAGRGVLLLISPSAAVGFNVDGETFDYVATAGYGVVTPETLVQMNMRIRQAKRREVYIAGSANDHLPTDENAILDELRTTTRQTALLAEFTAHGIPAASLMQGWITQLSAAYQAFDNIQRRDPLGFTAAYFARAGFTPQYDETEPTDAESLLSKAIAIYWKAFKKEKIQTTPAISRQRFDHLRESGKLRELDYFGRDRDKIETAAGGRSAADDPVYDRFNTGQKRARVYRAEMLTFTRAEVQRLDRDDAQNLPQHRRHYTRHHDFFMGALTVLLKTKVHTLSDILPMLKGHTFTEDDLSRLKAYCEGRGFDTACKILNYKPTADDPRRIASGVFHALLRSIYLQTTGTQTRPTINGNRVSVYTYVITPESLTALQEDLLHRQAYRQKEQEKVSANCMTDSFEGKQFTDTYGNDPHQEDSYDLWRAAIDAIPI